MSRQFQNTAMSEDYSESQKKLNCKKLTKKRLNTKQKKLKLLLTELISRINEKPALKKNGYQQNKNSLSL